MAVIEEIPDEEPVQKTDEVPPIEQLSVKDNETRSTDDDGKAGLSSEGDRGGTNGDPQEEHESRFTPEEVAALTAEAEGIKTVGNRLFAQDRYEDAIEQYQRALNTCPSEGKTERAVYWGNIGACYVKLGKHDDAVDACTKALAESPAYTKALLRRAQANEKLGTYTSLSSALEDYTTLSREASHQRQLNTNDRQTVVLAVRDLPTRLKEAQEKEKEEMLGKLKDLGNTILGKFGLSTDNFKMTKDEQSGNYNLQFVNNPNSSPDQDRSGSSGNGT